MTTTLKLFRSEVFRKKILPRFLSTEPPNDDKPPNKTEDIKGVEKDYHEKSKKKMASLLYKLNKSNIKPTVYKMEPIIPRKLSELTKKHIDQDKEVKQAVHNVALHLGGDVEKTTDELHTKYKSHTANLDTLKNLLDTMKLDHTKENNRFDSSYAQNEHKISRVPSRFRKGDFPVQTDYDYENMEPMNIFPPLRECDVESSKSQLDTWDKCAERDILASTTRSPRNAFEEMIQWTENGRMWTFPINNELGMEHEEGYNFTDHIFLERHLDPWCPKTGPIRQFMYLVCHGLSLNPYLPVNRKLAHIQWYQKFFKSKLPRKILLRAGYPKDTLVSHECEPLNFVNLSEYAKQPYPKPPNPIKIKRLSKKKRDLNGECYKRSKKYRKIRLKKIEENRVHKA